MHICMQIQIFLRGSFEKSSHLFIRVGDYSFTDENFHILKPFKSSDVCKDTGCGNCNGEVDPASTRYKPKNKEESCILCV